MGVQAGPRTDQTPPGNRILERVKARIVRELWRISFTPLTAELPAQTTARASLRERAQSRWSTAERAIPLRRAASDKSKTRFAAVQAMVYLARRNLMRARLIFARGSVSSKQHFGT